MSEHAGVLRGPESRASEYRGSKDVGRSDSLYQSAITKPDLDYSTQLLLSALEANPENEPAFKALMAKAAELSARRKAVRFSGSGGGADEFLKALALYLSNATGEQAIACASEAHRAGLMPYCAALGSEMLRQWESAKLQVKAAPAARLIELLEASGAFKTAVRAAAFAVAAFPADDAFREREKNLLARKYLTEHDPGAGDFRNMLQGRAQQEAAHRPADPLARFEELQRQFRASKRLEDFRELIRVVRDMPANRREPALPVLQEGYEQFGEKEMLWFIREIRLERRWAETRQARQKAEDHPTDAAACEDHVRLRQNVLREHVDHLYEVVSALPPGPDRQKRELELTRRLFEAGRFEEAIKQAQRLKGRAELRMDALVIMAKSFVQLELTLEAGACFDLILSALNADVAGAERALDAKYSYAEFLVGEAERKKDATLAAQARRLCADVMLEDIDYREIRKVSARAEGLMRK